MCVCVCLYIVYIDTATFVPLEEKEKEEDVFYKGPSMSRLILGPWLRGEHTLPSPSTGVVSGGCSTGGEDSRRR